MSIQQVQDALAGLPEIRVAIVFGSLASGHAKQDSDVDVAVQAASPLDTAARMRLVEDIATATGRRSTWSTCTPPASRCWDGS